MSSNTKTLFAEIELADKRIRNLVSETPLDPVNGLLGHNATTVYAKLENLQASGSFKLRGVSNKLSLLSSEQRDRGVVAASTGNHGAALAYAIRQLGGRARVFSPQTAAQSKLAFIQSLGAEISLVGEDSLQAETAAREYAVKQDLPYISPYNDLEIIAGQGTVACELNRQQPNLDAVFIALGGGGLASGIAAYLKQVSPQTQIVACSPQHSNVMMASVAAGKVLDLPSMPTFSDGTAGGLEMDAITFQYCAALIDRFIEVSEQEIANAVARFIDARRLLVEGAAGVALAGLRQTQDEWKGKKVAVIICGGNVGVNTLKQMLQLAS